MRGKNMAVLVSVVALVGLAELPAVAVNAPAQGDERIAIEGVLTDLFQGQDERDVERVRGALHAESRQFVVLPSGLVPFDRDTQLRALEAGQIGGDARVMTVQAVDITGSDTAMAKVQLVGRLTFVHYVGLLKLDGRWQVMSVVTAVKGL